MSLSTRRTRIESVGLVPKTSVELWNHLTYFYPPVIEVKLKDILRSAEMLARYLVAGAAAVLMFYCSTCLASPDYKQENQLLSREKRGSNTTKTLKLTGTDFLLTGIALSSTGLATIAGGLMGMLSIMGLPKLRRRVGQIGELRDLRAVAKPR